MPLIQPTEFGDLSRYHAAEFRSDMMRLGLAAMFGSKAARDAIASASADACIERALNPGGPGVAERYQATVEATLLACIKVNT